MSRARRSNDERRGASVRVSHHLTLGAPRSSLFVVGVSRSDEFSRANTRRIVRVGGGTFGGTSNSATGVLVVSGWSRLGMPLSGLTSTDPSHSRKRLQAFKALSAS